MQTIRTQTMSRAKRNAQTQGDLAVRLLWMLAPSRIHDPAGDLGERNKSTLVMASVMALGRCRNVLAPEKGIN